MTVMTFITSLSVELLHRRRGQEMLWWKHFSKHVRDICLCSFHVFVFFLLLLLFLSVGFSFLSDPSPSPLPVRIIINQDRTWSSWAKTSAARLFVYIGLLESDGFCLCVFPCEPSPRETFSLVLLPTDALYSCFISFSACRCLCSLFLSCARARAQSLTCTHRQPVHMQKPTSRSLFQKPRTVCGCIVHGILSGQQSATTSPFGSERHFNGI